MELYGLHDKNGKEYKLINDLLGTITPMAVELVEPEPKFEVGDWITGKDGYFPTEVKRVEKIDAHYCCYDDGNSCSFEYLRLATPAEIETHLRKICDEKYIGKRARCLYKPSDVFVVRKFERYDGKEEHCDDDQMVYRSADSELIVVYKSGKFAEIVPVESKELPKTIEELKGLLMSFRFGRDITPNVNTFLEEQGYKVD